MVGQGLEPSVIEVPPPADFFDPSPPVSLSEIGLALYTVEARLFNDRRLLFLRLLVPNRPVANRLVAVGAGELVVEPLGAAVLVEDMFALGHDLYLLAVLEGLDANGAVFVLVEQILVLALRLGQRLRLAAERPRLLLDRTEQSRSGLLQP